MSARVATVSSAMPAPRSPSMAAARPCGICMHTLSGTVSQNAVVCICISGKRTSP